MPIPRLDQRFACPTTSTAVADGDAELRRRARYGVEIAQEPRSGRHGGRNRCGRPGLRSSRSTAIARCRTLRRSLRRRPISPRRRLPSAGLALLRLDPVVIATLPWYQHSPDIERGCLSDQNRLAGRELADPRCCRNDHWFLLLARLHQDNDPSPRVLTCSNAVISMSHQDPRR